jgi:hypothetical protein
MTPAHRLLHELARRNVAITLRGTRLRLAPRTALDPALIARLVACRSELLAILAAASTAATPPSPRRQTPRATAAVATILAADPPRPASTLAAVPTGLATAPPPPSAALPAVLEQWLLQTLAEAGNPEPHATLHRRLDLAIQTLLRRGELQAGTVPGTLALRIT